MRTAFRLRVRLLLLGCGVVAAACAGDDRPPRALLIGIDGASPRVVEPLLESGRLPNLEMIANDGHYGLLRSSIPLLSPRVWTTVATGKTDAKHGIRSWVRPVGEDRTRVYISSDRRGLALWNIVSNSGRNVAVINWLVTYPPEVVRGVMVSDHAFLDPAHGRKWIGKLFSGERTLEVPEGTEAGVTVYPREWAGRALSEAHRLQRPSAFPDPFEDPTGFKYPDRIADYRNFYAIDQQIASVALEIEDELHPDLLMVLFQGIDCVSHHLWAGFEDDSEYPPASRYSLSQRRRARAAVQAYYEFTDDLIGLLVHRFTEDDLVVVVSDHGFQAASIHSPATGHLTGGHEDKAALDGVIFARGRHVRPVAAGELTRIVDVTPTILAWMGLPVGEDMDGKPAAFLDLEPPGTIATWDTIGVERVTERPSDADAAILERLESLGYIE